MSRQTYVALGDSQTDPMAFMGVEAWNTHGALVAAKLTERGYDYRARIFAKSGDTSTDLLARTGQTFRYDTPDIASVCIGVNDPGASITQATTKLNIRAIVLALKHGAAGDGDDPMCSVAGQANLPAYGAEGQRYVVLSDTSTTGGVAASEAFHAATITGTVANSGPAVWEYRTPLAGENGWGRVAVSATAPTAVKKIVVLSTNYLNWTTGGDTTGTPYATYVPVRTAQQDAVTAENVTVDGAASVVYGDLYNLQRSRILAGTDLNFASVAYDQTRSWHAVQNNQHHSHYGHWLAAQAVLAAMPAGWLA